MSHMRQSEMREPGASVSGDPSGQRKRREVEGKNQEPEFESDPLQERPFVEGEKPISDQGRGQDVQGMPPANVQVKSTALQPAKTFDVSEQGLITLSSLQDQLSFAKRLIDEKMISDTFKTVQQVVLGFQYCKALNIEPIVGLRMMYVVNGKPSLYSGGPLSLVQRSKKFHKIREWFINENGDEICPANKNLKNAFYFGSITETWRTGDDLPQIDFFTLEDMARAGLDKNKWGKKEVWEKWERIMLRYKGRTLNLRSKFADLIEGVPIAEYDDHFSPELPHIIQTVKGNSLAEEIEREYSEKPTESTMN